MNLEYDRASILQGNKLRRENEERPVTFAEYNGATEPIAPADMAITNQRMAGPVGARAMQLMRDPQAIQATDNWMNMFGQSNQGSQFNMAKQAQANAIAETAVMEKEIKGELR